MAWRDTLVGLRDELAEVRAQRRQRAAAEEAQAQQARQELSRLASDLRITEILSEMNAALLEGQGDVETALSWESPQDDQDGGDGDELGVADEENEEYDGDVLATVLTWEEDGEREIAVEVLLAAGEISMQVNGVEIRPERDALEQALVEAFRDELEL